MTNAPRRALVVFGILAVVVVAWLLRPWWSPWYVSEAYAFEVRRRFDEAKHLVERLEQEADARPAPASEAPGSELIDVPGAEVRTLGKGEFERTLLFSAEEAIAREDWQAASDLLWSLFAHSSLAREPGK
jgi:hypothetical protein